MQDYIDIFSNYVAPTNPKSDDNFNIFNVLDIEYDEVRLHSRMLKFLIEGNLEGFLNVLEGVHSKKRKSLGSFNQLHIEKTVSFNDEELSDGRIDLLIEFDDFLIIIENKIFAKDQKNQLIKYYEYLKSRGKDFLLLYLTPNGSPPDPKSTEDKEKGIKLMIDEDFHLISYKDHILKWLQEYEVNYNKSREILEQYINTVKKICRIMTEEDKNRILGLFKEENKFIQNFHLIKSDIDTIQKQIHAFWGEVSKKLNLENIGVKKIDFKEGSIMFDLFDKGRGQMNFYIQYKPNFTESPFMSIWLNSKKQKEFENKKVDHQDLVFTFQEGYLQKQEEKELFTKDVFINFIENEDIQGHIKLIADKIRRYLEDKKNYIDFLKLNLLTNEQ